MKSADTKFRQQATTTPAIDVEQRKQDNKKRNRKAKKMTRVFTFVSPIVLALGPQLLGQSFEVASIKPSNPQNRRVSMDVGPGGRFNATNATVRSLIRFAYQVPDVQISGGPNWINTEPFDIVATPGSDASLGQVQKMMQSLIAERFKLTLTRETKILKGYAMVLAKGGSKLRESTTTESSMTGSRGQAGATRLIAKAVSIQQFAASLSPLLAYPILDRTGLTGVYDFELEFTPFQLPPKTDGDDGAPPDLFGTSIFTAFQDQLGLRLESVKSPTEVFQIDHAERPSEN